MNLVEAMQMASYDVYEAGQSIPWVPVSTSPVASGYYLCWTPNAGGRPLVAWYEFNKGEFKTTRPVSHWAQVEPPTAA